jgi:hypothetical protein
MYDRRFEFLLRHSCHHFQSPVKQTSSGFNSWQRQEIFLYSTAYGPALGATQPHIEWIPGTLSPGIKRMERETDHPFSSSAEVKREWRCNSTPPYIFVFWCLSEVQVQLHLYRMYNKKLQLVISPAGEVELGLEQNRLTSKPMQCHVRYRNLRCTMLSFAFWWPLSASKMSLVTDKYRLGSCMQR